MKPATATTVAGFELPSEWKAKGKERFPEPSARISVYASPLAGTPLGSSLTVSAGMTREEVPMSKDNGSEPRRQVLWVAIASLLVNVARLLLDLVRKG
jgi:hypothetical protein